MLDLHISVDYPHKPGVLKDFALSVGEGEIVGLAGESGSGKSTLALAVLRLLEHKRAKIRGRIEFEGRDLLTLREKDMRSIRGRRIALVLQSPHAALNPMLSLGSHLSEAWRAHAPKSSWKMAALPLLERVCLPTDDAFLKRLPREISVGQAQRVLIAMALLHRPSLVIADEPTSSLDLITHAEILTLLRELNRELGTAILLISHDLLSVAALCSRMAILDRGEMVESGTIEQIFHAPQHAYTRKLIASHNLLVGGREPILR